MRLVVSVLAWGATVRAMGRPAPSLRRTARASFVAVVVVEEAFSFRKRVTFPLHVR